MISSLSITTTTTTTVATVTSASTTTPLPGAMSVTLGSSAYVKKTVKRGPGRWSVPYLILSYGQLPTITISGPQLLKILASPRPLSLTTNP